MENSVNMYWFEYNVNYIYAVCEILLESIFANFILNVIRLKVKNLISNTFSVWEEPNRKSIFSYTDPAKPRHYRERARETCVYRKWSFSDYRHTIRRTLLDCKESTSWEKKKAHLKTRDGKGTQWISEKVNAIEEFPPSSNFTQL